MHLGAPSARAVLQQQISRTMECEQDPKRSIRSVQKSDKEGQQRDRGLRFNRQFVLLALIADQCFMNPHAVLAARRLLPGGIWREAHTLAEQEHRLRTLIDKPAVHDSATQALAVLPWKGIAVKAGRSIAELRLLKRSADMNSGGVGHNSKMVAEMLVEEWPAHELQPGIITWLARMPNSPKLRSKWLARLRRFWGVHYRKLGSRAHLSPADERRKALKKHNSLRVNSWNHF
jgi:hypothetical protein